MAALKELGLMKCDCKYGGGGISGRAYSGGGEVRRRVCALSCSPIVSMLSL
jgi:hypothetical protein